MRNPHAGIPFSDSDDAIAAALGDVSIPALLLSCVHMAGPDLLDGPLATLHPAGLFLNEVQGYMSEEDQAAARALALDIIRDYRDRGCPEPVPVDPGLLKRMMDWLVCEDVPAEYVPMLLEEMELGGHDERGTLFTSDAAARADFPVIVIGCGMSGLLAAIRLQQAGIPYLVIEKNTGVGGTWWENTYPGARVDVGNHFYCYSFEPDDHWTEFFARQPELQGYFQSVMERHNITEWIASQVGDDADLLAKAVPDYPATGKRTLQDNGSWLRTLTRDNVELVRTPITLIEPDAVVTAGGARHPADVLVYATGFRVNDMVSSLKVLGRNGVELQDWWGKRPAAYLGMTVPEFPNFFMLYGPGTNLASGGSLIFHSECEVRYIMACLDLLIAGDGRAMEPRQDRYDDWYGRCQAELKTTVWASPSIKHSFYKNADGLVHSLSPWRAGRLLEMDPRPGTRRLRVQLRVL